MVSLDASISKEPISKRPAEIIASTPNHSLKSSPVTLSPDLLETNQSPVMPEEVNVTQPVHDEIHLRRYSVIGSGMSTTNSIPQQVCNMYLHPQFTLIYNMYFPNIRRNQCIQNQPLHRDALVWRFRLLLLGRNMPL